MVPKLQIHAGDPDPLPRSDGAVHFQNIHRICYIDDPSQPPGINRHWAVSDDFGIQLVSQRGQILPWIGASCRRSGHADFNHAGSIPGAFHCEGLASRPRNSHAENPYHLVYSESPADPMMGRGCTVCALEPDGSRRVLAGAPGAAGHRDGSGAQALFGGIADLAMDRSGVLFVLDRGNRMVRRIALDGTVSTLAGLGSDPEALFSQPMGMALDPRTGHLYICDLDVIVRVGPQGEMRRVLGSGDAYGSVGILEPRSQGPAPRIPSDPGGGLYRPRGLAIQGRNLFIADTGRCLVRILDLENGTLHTLAGHPTETRTRRGPLAYYSPGRSPEDCAALAYPRCVAFSTDGICMVGLGDCIAELDMPPFESQARGAARRNTG